MQTTSQAAPAQQSPAKLTARYQALKEVLRQQFMALPIYQEAAPFRRIALLAQWDQVFDDMVDEKAEERRIAESRLQ